MSDEHRVSVDEELARHELEGLAETHDKVIAELDSRKGEHPPPAVMALLKVTLDEGIAKGIPLKQVVLAAFLMGIEEGKKGKSYEDFVRCAC
jgi:hypothetical protein